jgi:hypothetical protein
MSSFDPFGNNPNNDRQENFDPFGNNPNNDRQENFDPFGNNPNDGQQQNERQPYGQGYYGQQPPYGQPPYGQPPYGQPPQQPDDHDGKSAKLYGIIGIILNIISCCLPAGLILGILALVRVGSSRKKLGYLSDDARLGKVLGIVSIVWGGITLLLGVMYIAFAVMMGLLDATGGGTVV